MCRSGRINKCKHGGSLSRPPGMENRDSWQPVLLAAPSALESAIARMHSGTEQRNRTTVVAPDRHAERHVSLVNNAATEVKSDCWCRQRLSDTPGAARWPWAYQGVHQHVLPLISDWLPLTQ
jgi:hypothetical protein